MGKDVSLLPVAALQGEGLLREALDCTSMHGLLKHMHLQVLALIQSAQH